jgi:hypothetical protein
MKLISYVYYVIKDKIRYEKENQICMVWYQLRITR